MSSAERERRLLRRRLRCVLFGCSYVEWQSYPAKPPMLIGRRIDFYGSPLWAILQDWCTRCGNPRPQEGDTQHGR